MRVWRRKAAWIAWVGVLALVYAFPARADHSGPDPLVDVTFEQKLDAQAPLGLTFVDERGRSVRLNEYFGQKPVLLVFAYYECPMLCTLVLNDLTTTLGKLAFDVGEQFEVVTVSIDPGETPELAGAKKAAYVEAYGRPGAEAGWHFLTGAQAEIERLAHAVGFRYVYDEELDQYAHPAGFIVLTPDGKVSRYFFGIETSPTELRLGLIEASERRIGNAVDQFILLCYTYDPATGGYTLLIENIARIVGVSTAVALAGLVFFLHRQERKEAGQALGS